MGTIDTMTLNPQAILQAWIPFKETIGVTSVHNQTDYARATATIDILLNAIGDDEEHPLANVIDYLAEQVRAYEEEHAAIPTAEPRDVLRLLMEQHGLKQEDLADCAPQGRISEILSGAREISKAQARRFARRFRVHADLFL
jgi:HTH-type transcriptional regulator/antitoxin HigA